MLAALVGDTDQHAAVAGIGFDFVMSAAEVGPLQRFALETGMVMITGLIAPGRHFAVNRTITGKDAIFQQSFLRENDVGGSQDFSEEAAMRIPDHHVARGRQLCRYIMPQFLYSFPCPDDKKLRVERPGVGLENQFFHRRPADFHDTLIINSGVASSAVTITVADVGDAVADDSAPRKSNADLFCSSS